MNILMLGWEYPPHISGGLGTACFGLVKAFSELKHDEITFVLPRLKGGEDHSYGKLISADLPELSSLAMTSLEESYYSHLIGSNEREKIDFFAKSHLSQSELPLYFGNTEVDEYDLLAPEPPEASDAGVYQGGSTQVAFLYAGFADQIIAEAFQVDVIPAHDWITIPLAIEIKKRTGAPLVVHIHSTETDRSADGLNSNIYRLEHLGMIKADRVISVSKLTADIIQENYGIHAEKISPVYNASDIEPSVGLRPNRKAVEKVVSFIGRITYQKGPKHFVEAAKIISEKNPDVRFIMAGTGDLLPMAKSLAKALGIYEKFEFPGFIDSTEVSNLLAMSDVYVMPSLSEPFGIGALEAIHSGVPIVLSKNSGVSEVIDNAWKVKPDDAEAIAEGVLSLLHDASLSMRLADAALQEASKLTWVASAQALRKIYQMVSA